MYISQRSNNLFPDPCYLLLSWHIHQLDSIIYSSLPPIQTIFDMKNFGQRVTLDLEGLDVDLHSIIAWLRPTSSERDNGWSLARLIDAKVTPTPR